MSEAITEFIVEKLGNRVVRVNLLTVVCVIIGVVCVKGRIDRWESTLTRMEMECWRVNDQREFAHQLKESNVSLAVPDPVRIVEMRSPTRAANIETKEE